MLDGFAEENHTRGVPMIPRPKSEAWLLCALRANPYQGCEALEGRSGNDNSPYDLKSELKEILGERASLICEMIESGEIDFDRIEMPSFRAFRARLEEVIDIEQKNTDSFVDHMDEKKH